MSKVTLTNLTNVDNNQSIVTKVNNNNTAITNAIENTISRDGTSPNQMNADLDMNSNRILNLPEPVTLTEPARLLDVNNLTGGGTINVLNNIPVGGTSEQVLTKNSSTDFDTSWQMPQVSPILCTATYAIPAGFATYTLTPVAGQIPIIVADGLRLRFVPTDTSFGGQTSVVVNGITYPLRDPDSYGFVEWGDIPKNTPITIEYVSSRNLFVIASTPVSYQQAIYPHGPNLQVDQSLPGRIHFGVFGAGAAGVLVLNPLTNQFRICRFFGTAQDLFNNTAYVGGIANQSLANNTFYYVYCFNPDGGNETDLRLDFYPAAPGNQPASSEEGFQIKSGDRTRTFIGHVYVRNNSVQFLGSGTTGVQILGHTVNGNPWVIPIQTNTISYSQTNTGVYESITNARASVVLSATSFLPNFVCSATCQNSSADADCFLRLSFSGVSIDGSGNVSPFSGVSDECAGTVPKINGYTTLVSKLGQAFADGYIEVVPQVKISAGTGTWTANMLADTWV
jgi:hypothetical protein